MQAEDADRAAERAEAAQGQRAEALSRLQDAHRRKARQLKDSADAVQQVRPDMLTGPQLGVPFKDPPLCITLLLGWWRRPPEHHLQQLQGPFSFLQGVKGTMKGGCAE